MYDDYARDKNYDRTQRVPRSPKVDARRLWAGGAATALVAALVAFIALLIARGIIGIPVLAPDEAGVLGDATTFGLCILAATGALLATGLMNLLLLAVPQSRTFFAAIAGLVTLAFALQPFMTGADLDTQIATAVVYLITGAVIIGLIGSVTDYAMG
ncbi:MAG: hypothetical protein GEV09_00660 [Pseudonocardiaceae bacterium]|nr:hypothetical protein [Pseudonocardiaceae bacterium]